MEPFARPGDFPFRCDFSLIRLIEWWEAEAKAGQPLALAVLERLAAAPELRAPALDRATLERHRELVDILMSAVFPRAGWEQQVGGALVPFMIQALYATPALGRLLAGEDGFLRGRINMDGATGLTYRILHAYAHILRRFYGITLDLDYPLIVSVTDPETGWDRHFKAQFDGRFVTLDVRGELPALGEDGRRRLLANLSDPAVLMELLPPSRFAFSGFTVFSGLEVTDHELLSSLRRDLIERESIVSPASFERLEGTLRAYFRRPGLHLGLAAFDCEQVFLLTHKSHIEEGCIFADSTHYRKAQFAGSIYERASLGGRPLIVEDLTTWPVATVFERDLLDRGVRSLILAPLHYQDRPIGLLELASDQAGDFNPTHAFRLAELLPLFAMAVKRSMDELNARIQAFIKEKCTAIHPSVEWRFRQAVLNTIERRGDGELEGAEMEPIVFEGVWPLYGLADVRGSSVLRSLAIQADLLAQLRLAREAVEAARRARALPALDELIFRIDRHLARIETAPTSGDEVTVVAFLRSQVEPVFEEVAAFGAGVRERIAAYRAALDPRLGTVYRRRQAFEDSIGRLSDAISSYLDLEQQVAQGMFPHYFEKQKTDGVDYQIYVGASLVENGRFAPLYLRNLRLWQLMATCGIAARAERLKPALPVPLETTHLILVQHAPLSIRFRFDEKRFDVDGAYNARYEIIKKRIDKAVVRGTGERVTQPGRIAIVYIQPAEAAEYRDYIEYLQGQSCLTGEVEDVELDELQGAHGLRALRVTVDLGNPRLEHPGTTRDLLAAR